MNNTKTKSQHNITPPPVVFYNIKISTLNFCNRSGVFASLRLC